jgi:hypothetical protein
MAQFSADIPLSSRYQYALALAYHWHCNNRLGFQMRKDGTPYLAHLLSVSALVIENGGNEDEAIAALAHDAIEDAEVSSEAIASYLGQPVADIVLELSEPKNKDMTWHERKLVYIRQIREGSQSAVFVSLADKVHNALSYLKGARIKAKDNSQSKTEQTLWFLNELAGVYRDRLPGNYLVEVLERTLQELKIIWSGDTAHIVDGKFFSNACDWEREFSEPDYPEDIGYPDDFSRPYWIAIRDKGFWFEAPTLDIVPMEVSRPINLLQDINIKYYESGEVFASVLAKLNGQELVVEMWGKSAEWLSCYASQKGAKVWVDVLRRDIVEGVYVAQVRISDSQMSDV